MLANLIAISCRSAVSRQEFLFSRHAPKKIFDRVDCVSRKSEEREDAAGLDSKESY